MKKVTVFLGGTCAGSKWREELLPKLDSERVETYNPVVPNWTPECQAIEDFHRETDDVCLYVITPEGEGDYSFVEVTDDSHKRPDSTILCVIYEVNGVTFSKHRKSTAEKTSDLVQKNGVAVVKDLDEVASLINNYYVKKLEKK